MCVCVCETFCVARLSVLDGLSASQASAHLASAAGGAAAADILADTATTEVHGLLGSLLEMG